MRHFLTLGTLAALSLENEVFDGAYALVVDLATNPDETMRAAAAAFMERCRHTPKSKPVFIQIPALPDPRSADVLTDAMTWRPHGILLPGAKSGMDVQHLAARLAVGEARNGIADGITRILAITGQAKGSLFEMGSFAGSSHRLSGLVWSPDALIKRLGANAPEESGLAEPFDDAIRLGRTLTLIAAADSGVPAIDATPCGKSDPMQVSVACERARQDGFSGYVIDDPAMLAALSA